MRYIRTITMGCLLYSMLFQAGCVRPVEEPRVYETPGGFLLGAEDLLEITVWKNLELSRIIAIRPDGFISMPIIGDIQAAGITTETLAQRIAERYKEYIHIPSVSVNVKELNSYSVYVIGEVAKPGKYQLKSYVTVLQAISLAGGFTNFASKNKLQVVRVVDNGGHRRQELHIPLRYDDLVSGGGEPGNIVLHSGDTVVAP
ncbi:MAG: polysaccharide biosynthesis/export family protein [Nitrospirota bacterium]